MKSFIYYILATIVIYVYLHNPILSITGFGVIKILYILLPLLMYPQVRKLLKHQRVILFYFYAIILFCCIRTLLGGNSSFIYTSIIACIEVFFIPLILINYLFKYKIDFYKVMLGVGALSCIITVFSLFIPSFHSFIRGLIIEYEIFEKMKFRGYGLSEGLSYAYGIILGMIGAMSLPIINKNKWFVVFLPLLALSILVNARTGIIIYFGCIGIYLIKNFRKNLKLYAWICIAIIILSYANIKFAISDIGFEEEYTSIFIEEFFNELSDTFLGTDKANFSTSDTLFKEMIVWPNDFFQWIIGTGESVYLAKKNSDIGFIIQLNYGGIVYMLLLISLICKLLKQVKDKYIKYTLLITFIIANIKGDFILNSGGFRLFMLIVLIYSCKKYYNNYKYLPKLHLKI